MIATLQKQIFDLKIAVHNEQSIDLKIKMQKELYKKKIELLDLIHEKDKTRAGLSARQLIEKVKNMPSLPKFQTGINKIDNAFDGGFETGLFINLASESGAGKTTLVTQVIANIAEGNKAVFFNFEMGDKLFVKRLLDLNLNDKQLDNMIIDSDTTKIEDLIMEIELYAEEGIKFFGIDSKMKIHGGTGAKEYERISNMSKELARLCARKDIIIILINQMNEEDIKNKRLAFKGSGDQKYDSDIALFLVKNGEQRKLICTKNRMNDRLFSIDIGKSDYNNAPIETVYKMSGALDKKEDVNVEFDSSMF